MTTAFSLIRKVLSRDVPPRAVLWGFLNTLNRNLRTGNRRFEFERLYLENNDPWNYKTSEYERNKYQRTLDAILKWRRGNQTVLEIGCSVGAFSRMLASNFVHCTAIDVSSEVLRLAADYNQEVNNVRFIRDDLRSMDLGTQFDVIVCAEILYYILQQDSDRASRNLYRHSAHNGIVVTVSGVSSCDADPMYFGDWEEILPRDFELIHDEVISDFVRPYRICVFSRRG